MYSPGDIRIGPWRVSRVWQHLLFWFAVYVFMVVVYGYGQRTYLIAARNNLFYGPVHIVYFYTLAYWLVPKFLVRRKTLVFLLLFVVLFFATIYLSRIVDVAFVDPYNARKLGPDWAWYPRGTHTFWEKVTDPTTFFAALRGVNLVVWSAMAIKLFKLWIERRNAALQTELSFLKNQVHPHFLFNTLNSLYALSLEKSDQAPEVVMKLSDLMRYMLYECDTEAIELEKDLRMLKEYIDLEKTRYGDRLDFSLSVNGDTADLRVPPLLLLPLVENAFKHGASRQRGETWISANLSINGSKLKFDVSNSKPERKINTGGGQIGLKNLRKRLQLLYDQGASLKIFDEDDMFLAVLEIDLHRRSVI